DKSRKTEYLALSQTERDTAVRIPPGSEVGDLEADFSLPVASRSIQLVQVPAYHHAYHSRVADLTALELARVPAIAEDYHPVGNLLDLAHPVRYVDDTYSLRPQVPGNCQQAACLGQRQARRGLIHYEDPGVER